jgi:hypothetical protein
MKKTLIFLNVVAFITTLVINFLSQSGPINGVQIFPYDVQQLANNRAVFFLPANYVFGIWGLIYTALGAYIIYQALGRNINSRVHEAIGPWFIVSSIANSTWLVLFLNDWVVASTLAMFVLLASLIIMYLRLGIGRVAVTRGEYWAVHFAFSIYLGWITVATVANVSTAVYVTGAETALLGIASNIWTVIMMAVAAVVGVAMLARHRDVAFAGVIVWALVGIYARPFTTPTYDIVQNQDVSLVNNAALVIAIIVFVAAAFTFVRSYVINRGSSTLKAV